MGVGFPETAKLDHFAYMLKCAFGHDIYMVGSATTGKRDWHDIDLVMVIPDKEYKLYILAQLHVLRLQNDGKVHALIDPFILVGDKAWKRWKLWRKYYIKQLEKPRTEEELEIQEKKSRVLINLDRTKKF